MSNPFVRSKDRTELETDMCKFLQNGGVVETLPSDHLKGAMKQEIRRILYFSVHHRFYAINSGVPLSRIKKINRNINEIKDVEIAKLWAFIQSRQSQQLRN
ncbi:hypothetical protein [uncultured Acinetobacter sp.]|uniref:hypothetical protein n=1 Tax=uncultured Acinetobacter sp. TaxID=165433 RepID=UPI0025854DD1|nr:hypothetical protein [uncultured Acinetobacter sp.]